jgi:hypothetical protein
VDPPGDRKHPNDTVYVDDKVGMRILKQDGKEIIDVLETARAQIAMAKRIIEQLRESEQDQAKEKIAVAEVKAERSR